MAEMAMVNVTAHDVARHIKARLPGVAVMKTLKLVYYAQAYALAWRGVPLFSDELEAWDKGPVVRALWMDLKFGRSAWGPPLSAHDAGLVNRMLDMYGGKSGAELSALTHAEQPWREARGRSDDRRGTTISLATMRQFYSDQWELQSVRAG